MRPVRALLLAVASLPLLLAAPASADEAWVIQSFAADMTIQNDASIRVVEAVDVDFGSAQKHGIIRKIAVRFRAEGPMVRVYRLTVRSVTDAQARPVTYTTSDEGPYAVIKIGDPDAVVTGARSYRVTYDLYGALNPFPDHDELNWNVTGDQSEVPTRSTSATVRAPGGVQRVACFQGVTGSDEPCRSGSTATVASFATTRSLRASEQLTVVVALAKGAVAEPAPLFERDTDDPQSYFEMQPAFLALGVFVLVGGLVYLFWRWYTVGRDVRERETIVPEYEPPDTSRPAQLGLLLDESADTKDVTATIVDLAVRGYLTITEEPSTGLFAKKDWTLHSTGKGTAQLLPYEKTVYDGLFESGADVKLSGLRTHFVTSLRRAQSQLYRDSADRR
jgi:hypothetical protein